MRSEPRETDSSLEALWTQRLGSSPVTVATPIFDGPGGYDERFHGYRPATRYDDELVETIERCCRPAGIEAVAKELARVRLATASRAACGAELEAWIEVAVEELMDYPLDVVRAVCRDWVRRQKWLPTVAELVEACETAVRRRRALLQAAKTWQPLRRPQAKEIAS